MNKITSTFLVFAFSLVLLAGCSKTDQAPEIAPDVPVPLAELSEEERISEMIKMIEAEEARMEAAGEL